MPNVFNLLAKLQNDLVSVATTAESTASRARQAVTDLKRQTDDADDHLNRAIGDLESYIGKIKNGWSQELDLELDKVRLGGERIDEFLRKFGDWKVVTENGVKTIRQMMEGLDVRGYEAKMQELVEAIHKGTGDTKEALDLLRTAGGALSAEFVELVQKFATGQVSLQRLEAALDALKKVLGPNSAGAQLAQELADAASEGRIGAT